MDATRPSNVYKVLQFTFKLAKPCGTRIQALLLYNHSKQLSRQLYYCGELEWLSHPNADSNYWMNYMWYILALQGRKI